jgi:purine-cytosine permease-like protein
VQNVAPRVPQRALVTAVGAVGLLLALVLSVDRYQVFLLLIGSVFVPLAGVFLADYFVLRRGRYGRERLFEPSGTRWWAIVPWAVGFVLYHWSVPTGPGGWVDAMHTIFATWLHLPFPLLGSRIGASVPSFAVAFLLSLAVLGAATRSRLSTSGVGPPPAR